MKGLEPIKLLSPAPKNPMRKHRIFLSKPQAWYIIDARSAAHIIKGGEPPLYIITRQRVFSCSLMIYNGKPLMIYRNKLRMIYTPLA